MSEIKKGNISIHAQNIMPVIKRWLYSDKDIFIRELVANGCDAVTKYRMATGSGEEGLKVTVTVDKEKGELRFTDNGIGMTAEELDKYINQVAFSSAEEFLKKYQGDAEGGIIGHFGLGFYSAFMPADKVIIDTLSYQEGARAVRWESEDGMAYEMSESDRPDRGTTITLHISEEEKEFLDTYRVRQVLSRYCGYMAVPIYLEDTADKPEAPKEGEEPKAPQPINETHPLWLKAPKDCTEQEYKDCYHKLFNTFEEPLFWIHLNVDYPFNLKGILYFPRIRKDFGGQEGEIKLFNRQVFVADNIKEIIPEFLLLLRGVLDCPDLPLNVSRSFLQNDGYVKKLSAHITKKVADKLNALMNTERETYQTYWDDIHPFVKYGCLRDEKFYEAVKGSLLFKTTAGEYLTLDEYKSRNEGKTEKKVYYTSDAARQAASVKLYTDRGMDVVIMDSVIDISFMQHLENMGEEDKAISFARVDADADGLTDTEAEAADLPQEELQKLFRDAVGDENLTVKTQALKDHDLPLMLLEDEQMRRYREMAQIYGQGFALPEKPEVVLNTACPAVRSLAALEDKELQQLLAKQYFDIARMSSRPLEKEELSQFIANSYRIAAKVSEKA
ncbi:MAG: molecular chaperone HtpG [Clostridia bacterium]|nr:molecular chaperone HtpG [Clostridia bacterium]